MTEDTSPENLCKFLESDDPALVRRGISMAKESGVPKEMLGEILWMYMFNDDKTIRAIAKSTFIKLAPEDAKQAVKKNWKASYRAHCVNHGPGKWVEYYGPNQLGILGKVLCQTSVSLVEPLIKALRDKYVVVHQHAEAWKGTRWFARALGEIGDAQAVDPLIKALGDKGYKVRTSAAEALGKIGDKRAVEPLIKTLSKTFRDEWWGRDSAAEALGKIGDKRAVGPLIKALRHHHQHVRWTAAKALGKIGDARATLPLIKALRDDHQFVRKYATEALGEVGDKQAVEPLIGVLSDEDSDVRSYAFKALGKIGDARAVQPLIEILGDNRLSVIKAAAGALGMIGDARAVKPLFKTFENENLGLIKVTAKTIVKIKGTDIEDEERKNVLKFLKSKDPAMVRMGASMLKGILEE